MPESLTRAFVAVEISETARQQLARLIDGFRRMPGATARWVRPELMHLTLVFLGEVSQEFLESAKVQLREVSSRHAPFTARLKGLGAFPSPARARVVWVGTEPGRREVCSLQAAVSRSLGAIGYQPERRPFSPHLTIGRLRTPGDVGRATTLQFESEQFTIDRIVLFRSVLGPTGPTYTRLAEFPLEGRGGSPEPS